MQEKITDIARKIARMSSSDLDELQTALMGHGISATMYRFSPLTSVWDMHTNVYHLALVKCGNRKLAVVKTIRDEFGWGLMESKRVADQAPTVINKALTLVKAEELEEIFKAIGATVEIRDSNNDK